jgi:hypothetical protein
MIFAEIKKEDGYEYETEDLFGKISFFSENKLDKNMLDSIVMTTLKHDVELLKINLPKDLGEIKVKYDKRKQWTNEEDDEPIGDC